MNEYRPDNDLRDRVGAGVPGDAQGALGVRSFNDMLQQGRQSAESQQPRLDAAMERLEAKANQLEKTADALEARLAPVLNASLNTLNGLGDAQGTKAGPSPDSPAVTRLRGLCTRLDSLGARLESLGKRLDT